MSPVAWVALFAQLLLLSLLQVGGGLTVAPDLHRLLVEQAGLLSDAQFAASVAIAQASPGPNVLYVAVLGYQFGGLPAALATQLALVLPSSLLAVAAERWGSARASSRAILAFKTGMAPISIALLGATSWIIVSQSAGWRPVALAALAALAVWRTRLHLLVLIGAGALAGALGWI